MLRAAGVIFFSALFGITALSPDRVAAQQDREQKQGGKAPAPRKPAPVVPSGPDISGTYSGWGRVVLQKTGASTYSGTYSQTYGGVGRLTLTARPLGLRLLG